MANREQPSLVERTTLLLLAAALVTWAVWPITSSALQGDDVPNSMRSAVLKAASQSRWEYISESIGHWLRDQGRFFPISAIENVYLFSTVHSVTLYKLVQLVVLVILTLVMGLFVRLFVGVRQANLIVALTFCAALQTRNWYDPTFGFSLLLQSVALKVFLGAIFFHLAIVKTKKAGLLLVSVLFWSAALLQYEVVITLLPVFFIIAMVDSGSRKKQRLLLVTPHLFAALIYVVVSQQLRAGKIVAPAYTTNPDISQVLPTYLRQLSGSTPFAVHLWKISSRTFFSSVSGWSSTIFVCVSIVLVLVMSKSASIRGVSSQKTLGLFLIGLNFVVGPGLPTSLSIRWQAELSWGLAYLPVFLQYLGVGLMMSAIVIWLASKLREKPWSRFILSAFLTGLVLSASSNHRLMSDNVTGQQGPRQDRMLYESAVRAGLFKGMANSSIVRSPLLDGNPWINDYFTAWLGGPEDLVFVRNLEEETAYCDIQKCQSKDVFLLDQVLNQDNKYALVITEVARRGPRAETYWPEGQFRVAQDSSVPGPCSSDSSIGRTGSIVVYDCLALPK